MNIARKLLRDAGLGVCNLCGFLIVRIGRSLFDTRCLRCRSTQIHRSVGVVLDDLALPADAAVYELSSRGALHRCLKRRFRRFTCSEYFEDVPPGETRRGIVCQDVQRLLYGNHSFDLVTSTEVFEHVADDLRGFREVHRVLRPGGSFVFTVPIRSSEPTRERARPASDGQLQYLAEPCYHGEHIRGRRAVLAFRDYGPDIVDRLAACGFQASLRMIASADHLIDDQPVLVARKAGG